MKCGSNPSIRFTRKNANQNERLMVQNWWAEITKLYGTYIDYYTYDYATSAHDFFYGEHTLAPFGGPTPMIVIPQINNDALLLSKFGIRTDSDATFIIPIKTFREVFGSNDAEPKAGDLIRMTEFGWDRPGGVNDINELLEPCSGCNCSSPIKTLCKNTTATQSISCGQDQSIYSEYDDAEVFGTLIRGAPVYEITERRDENVPMGINMLQGHYVWIIHARHFDYSYQPNAPRTPGSDQVSDETIYGKLSGGSDFPENTKTYADNLDQDSKKIWDYTAHPGNDSSVYGGY